jgi:hypothetical protein
VERVAQAWRSAGAAVALDGTRFLNDDETAAIVVPELPAGTCTTIVLLGPRGLGFHVRVGDEDNGGKRVASEAGALSIERCGEPPPRRLLVTSVSGRGAVEMVVARSGHPLAPLRLVLPERTSGNVTPGQEPGLLPPLPPPDKRAEAAEARARRDGATIANRTTLQAGADGSGAAQETLQPACHVFRLFPLDTRDLRGARHGKVDLDAEMRRHSDDRLLARDRSDAPDADLEACVGETTRAEILFAGSLPSEPVLVAHFAWPLPEHLPTLWGSEARARMAHALLVRHVISLPRDPFLLVQGGSGATPIPLSIEPGGCYVAAVVLVQGAARAVGLRVRVGASDAFDDRGIDEVGAVVGFCSGEHDRAVARVEARGAPLLGWGLAVYRLDTQVWEVSP